MFPSDVLHSLRDQWPCRDIQIKQLASLLSPVLASSSTVVVHGISATGKSTIVRNVLACLKQPHAIVRSPECITARHLLTKILWATMEALGLQDEWESFGKGRCENVSTLAVLLAECLAQARIQDTPQRQFVLVLDGIEQQREAPPTLLLALARLGENIPSLCVVLIQNSPPRPLFLQLPGVPHVNFPPYTRDEAIRIILNADPPCVRGISTETTTKIYPDFVAIVYDSLVGPTAGTVPTFRLICERLWPQFVAPIAAREVPPSGNTEWNFARLLVRNRSLFQQQGESALVHHILPDPVVAKTIRSSSLNTTLAPSRLPSLPYFPTLILTSAYIASHIPPRLDTIFFSKYSSTSRSARSKLSYHRRRLGLVSQTQADNTRGDGSSTPSKRNRGQRTRITKSTFESTFPSRRSGAANGIAGLSSILTARPFPLERLIAIYHAIDPNPPADPVRAAPVADAIYAELSSLRSLRLVVPASGRGVGSGTSLGSETGIGLAAGSVNKSPDVAEKWRINVSGDWIRDIAREIGVEVDEWLTGGLD